MIQRDASERNERLGAFEMPLDALQGEWQCPRGRSHEADADVRPVQRSIDAREVVEACRGAGVDRTRVARRSPRSITSPNGANAAASSGIGRRARRPSAVRNQPGHGPACAIGGDRRGERRLERARQGENADVVEMATHDLQARSAALLGTADRHRRRGRPVKLASAEKASQPVGRTGEPSMVAGPFQAEPERRTRDRRREQEVERAP